MSGPVEHTPVLCDEALSGLKVRPGGRYVDATLGAGGHAARILAASAPHGQVLAMDADPEAARVAQETLHPFGSRLNVQVANFRHLAQYSTQLGFDQVDGILMDLGLSSLQLADGARGFSFSREGPLDMRFDPGQGEPASALVNGLSEVEMASLLWRFGEERQARRLARAIVAARPLNTTGELAALCARIVGWREKIHPATRTFQALRIAVNDELSSLAEALPQARDLLAPGGRLVVISFHSLEDRLVKHFLVREASDCICPPEAPICTCDHRATMRIVSRRPVRPSTEEQDRNPRSRSARMRIGERLYLDQPGDSGSAGSM
jgi:16S rRNA (cytosine1402-N4)-methyltransferase